MNATLAWQMISTVCISHTNPPANASRRDVAQDTERRIEMAEQKERSTKSLWILARAQFSLAVNVNRKIDRVESTSISVVPKRYEKFR